VKLAPVIATLLAVAAIGSSPAADVAERLAAMRVAAPDGASVTVYADGDPSAVLDRARLDACLDTVEEAGAWPEAWLVVQDDGLAWDLVVRLERDAGGAIRPSEAVALLRREWDPRSLRDALREALGRKPEGKVRNVVIQGFTKRIVTTYPYEPDPSARGRGLMALLPEDAVLREARSVDLGDGRRHTLAIVLRDARFEPVDCASASGAASGHLDRGTVVVVLAGPDRIESELDLTGELAVDDAGALRRYPCATGESPASLDPARVRDWIRTRDPEPLIEWVDADGDGHALEVRIPRAARDGAAREVVVAVDPDEATLEIVR